MRTSLMLGLLVVGVSFGCGGTVEPAGSEVSCKPLPCPYPGFDTVTCKCRDPADAGMGGAGGSSQGGSAGAPNGGAAGAPNGGAAGAPNGGAAGAAAAPGWSACDEPYQCTLVDLDCCHMECFTADLNAFGAVNTNFSQQLVDSLCTPPPPCPGYYCTENDHNEWIKTSSQFGVTCEAGQCKGFDIRSSPLSACNTSADCTLRWGLGCCEVCSPSPLNLVSIAKDSNIFDVVCGNVDVDCCPPPPFPPNAAPYCDSTSHCAVLWAK